MFEGFAYFLNKYKNSIALTFERKGLTAARPLFMISKLKHMGLKERFGFKATLKDFGYPFLLMRGSMALYNNGTMINVRINVGTIYVA